MGSPPLARLRFHDEDRAWLGGCSTGARDETCEVPEGAATGEITATTALDVDVVVLLLPGASTP